MSEKEKKKCHKSVSLLSLTEMIFPDLSKLQRCENSLGREGQESQKTTEEVAGSTPPVRVEHIFSQLHTSSPNCSPTCWFLGGDLRSESKLQLSRRTSVISGSKLFERRYDDISIYLMSTRHSRHKHGPI